VLPFFRVSLPKTGNNPGADEKKVKSSGLTIGSRRMTSGFGGSAISLVKIENVDPFIKYAKDVYNAEFGLPLKIYPLKIENGTAKL